MSDYLTFPAVDLPPLDSASLTELQALAAEAMGWQSLGEGVYLHLGSEKAVIEVVGIAKADMAGSNVLWLV